MVFKKPALFYAFRKWNSAVREKRFEGNKKKLQSKLLLLSHAYGPALMSVHKIISSVWDDPGNRWIKAAEPGSPEAYMSYQQHLEALELSISHDEPVLSIKDSSTRRKGTSRLTPVRASSRWSPRALPVKPFEVTMPPNSLIAGGQAPSSGYKRTNTLSFEDQQSKVVFLTVSNIVKTRQRLIEGQDDNHLESGSVSEVSSL